MEGGIGWCSVYLFFSIRVHLGILCLGLGVGCWCGTLVCLVVALLLGVCMGFMYVGVMFMQILYLCRVGVLGYYVAGRLWFALVGVFLYVDVKHAYVGRFCL